MRKITLSFAEATEEPHFDNISFRIKKKIFATYNPRSQKACLKLPEILQNVFCSTDKLNIYPVANKWGKQGWTIFEIKKISMQLLEDALITAYCTVAPKKLSELIRPA